MAIDTHPPSKLAQHCLNQLRQFQAWGYHTHGNSASEPAALTCLAACAMQEQDLAISTARWLAKIQTKTGSVGVTAELNTPAWPTSLAILAWRTTAETFSSREFGDASQRALQWSLNAKGKTQDPTPVIGHDPTILGWSWAADTHSWMEPTCMFVLALKAAGYQEHARTRDGVRMIVDRLLETGGSNFGNTRILGQATLPQVQSTGLSMLALADEKTPDVRIDRSLDYLHKHLQENTSTASLCFGLLGLSAHNRRPDQANHLLEHAWNRELQYGPSAYKTALIVMASLTHHTWLPREQATQDRTDVSSL